MVIFKRQLPITSILEPLYADSSKLLTFNTPFGRHRFKRMTYGLHSASEVFQETISKIICGVVNAENPQDDVIVWGKDLQFHSETLKKVFEKIRSHHLKLSKSNCHIAVNELVFLGHIISRCSIYMMALMLILPQPTNKTQTRTINW